MWVVEILNIHAAESDYAKLQLCNAISAFFLASRVSYLFDFLNRMSFTVPILP